MKRASFVRRGSVKRVHRMRIKSFVFVGSGLILTALRDDYKYQEIIRVRLKLDRNVASLLPHAEVNGEGSLKLDSVTSLKSGVKLALIDYAGPHLVIQKVREEGILGRVQATSPHYKHGGPCNKTKKAGA